MQGCETQAGDRTASIAMATYNGAKYLEAQLQSIAAQTHLPHELVITDDRSSDTTEAIVREFSSKVPFPVHFHQNDCRLGFARNFARAISLCKGEIIFFCDQDDVWLPAKIDRMIREFDNSEVLLVYSNAVTVDAAGERQRIFYDACVERSALEQQPTHPWHASFGMSQAFRSKLRVYDDLWPQAINHVDLENELLAHDQWYFFLAKLLGRVIFIDEVLVRYRQHGDNVVGAPKTQGNGLSSRLKARLHHAPRHDEIKRQAAERRALLLSFISDRVPFYQKDDVLLLRELYLDLAARLQRRYTTYTSRSRCNRLSSFVTAIASADYRGRPWAFDPRSIVRDLIAGVLA